MAALMLFRFFMRRNAPAPAMQYAGMQPGAMNQGTPASFEPFRAASGSVDSRNFPPGFDAAAFSREAKVNFLRLQVANDAGNLDDLRAFTTPEVFAELSMQLAERGDREQKTDVEWLDAEVLACSDEDNRHIVSVRFSGQIREFAAGEAAAFNEIWHLSKPASGPGGWVIAGIQQA